MYESHSYCNTHNMCTYTGTGTVLPAGDWSGIPDGKDPQMNVN